MALSLSSDSTLTKRYQTTVPDLVRKALCLKKDDKIRYTVEPDGRVLISRVDHDEDDPVLSRFLTFLANDIGQNPQHVTPVSPGLVDRVRSLVSGVEIDLNQPLSDEDD